MNGAAFIPCRLHRRGAEGCCLISWETLIKSLSDFTLEFLYMTRNSLTRTASYLRKAMTKSCKNSCKI